MAAILPAWFFRPLSKAVTTALLSCYSDQNRSLPLLRTRYEMKDFQPMNIVEASSGQEFANIALDIVVGALSISTNPVIILPTGLTPLPIYREWAARYKAGEKKNSNFTYLQLDEYVGLPADDERLFQNWLDREILSPLEIKNRIVFNSNAPDPSDEINRMTQKLREIESIDLAIVGMGMNGHVGFNEPDMPFDQICHIADLTQVTIEENSKYWPQQKIAPKQVYTLGIETLKRENKTMMILSSKKKRENCEAI